MKTSNDSTPDRAQSTEPDDLEQVRQLLLGDIQAQQERELNALRHRVEELEKLVEALIAHGDASRRAWQTEVSALRQNGQSVGSPRAVSQQVTPLTPRTREADHVKDD